jgi:hypothetical protein
VLILVALLGIGFVLIDEELLTMGKTVQFNLSINASDFSNFYGDGYNYNTHNQTTILAWFNHDTDPATYTDGVFEINTSDIPDTAVINWANFSFYIHQYLAPVGITKDYVIYIKNMTALTLIYYGTYSATGWKTVELPTYTLLLINKTWNTTIRFVVYDSDGCGDSGDMASSPESNDTIETESFLSDFDGIFEPDGGIGMDAVGCQKKLSIRAREYPTSPTFGAYLTVNYGD